MRCRRILADFLVLLDCQSAAPGRTITKLKLLDNLLSSLRLDWLVILRVRVRDRFLVDWNQGAITLVLLVLISDLGCWLSGLGLALHLGCSHCRCWIVNVPYDEFSTFDSPGVYNRTVGMFG